MFIKSSPYGKFNDFARNYFSIRITKSQMSYDDVEVPLQIIKKIDNLYIYYIYIYIYIIKYILSNMI